MGNCLDSSAKVESSSHSPHANSGSSGSRVSSKTSRSTVPSSLSINSYSSLESLPTPRTEGEILSSPNLKPFTFSELKSATRNFRPDSLLGEGGFGYVFKGWIDGTTLTACKPGSGIVVAVKKLKTEGFQGHKEWLEFNSKLSDFGLAKAGPTGDRTHVSTQVMGTHGYAAPEYVATGEKLWPLAYNLCFTSLSSYINFPSTGRLTAKSDVYSFGVVLLELLSGRRAVDKSKVGVEQSLVDWATPYLGDKRKLFRIMDTRLGGQYPQKGAYTAASLALQCLNPDAKLRPKMSEVLAKLDQLESTTTTKPGASRQGQIDSPRGSGSSTGIGTRQGQIISPRGSGNGAGTRQGQIDSPRGSNGAGTRQGQQIDSPRGSNGSVVQKSPRRYSYDRPLLHITPVASPLPSHNSPSPRVR
ncbi:hypothetical protein Bca4012_059914 [Brassica carinata]